ncbi:MAG: hypothetical protein KatS3mg077_3265 [Candidatus Binatia bacterium]|nr:MAG: hypothetical protein KatS3mg077_3265 [Candidatus Binatia bacterium]
MSFSEVLTVLALTHILAISALVFGRTASGIVRLQEVKREAVHTNILALDMFAREWRIAGFSANGQPIEGVAAPSTDAVDLRADLDGDGALSGFHERIAYQWDANRGAVMRATQSSSPQPWLQKVPPGGFVLTYLDPSGAPMPDPASEVRRISGVRLQLRTEWAVELPPASSLSAGFDASLSVARRNR